MKLICISFSLFARNRTTLKANISQVLLNLHRSLLGVERSQDNDFFSFCDGIFAKCFSKIYRNNTQYNLGRLPALIPSWSAKRTVRKLDGSPEGQRFFCVDVHTLSVMAGPVPATHASPPTSGWPARGRIGVKISRKEGTGPYPVVVGEGRPSTDFSQSAPPVVDGRAKPNHDAGRTARLILTPMRHKAGHNGCLPPGGLLGDPFPIFSTGGGVFAQGASPTTTEISDSACDRTQPLYCLVSNRTRGSSTV
jgi:hypothetical protein